MTLGNFINPVLQRQAQLVDRQYPMIDTSNMNDRLLDTISNIPQLQAQGRKLAQQQQIQQGVSQVYSQPNLSTADKLQQVGNVYGRAGAASEALAANTAYEDQKDKDLKQKIETFTAVGKLLGNAYQSSLQESPDNKEEAIKKVNNLLDGLIKSGIGKDVEDALRGMAQSGYEFSLSNDNKRDLRVVDNQDGTQSIVDIAKYLPKNKSSIVIEGSATGAETLAQAKAKAQMRSEIALNQTAQEIAMKEQADIIKNRRETVVNNLKKKIQTYEDDLINIDKALITVANAGDNPISASVLPVTTARLFQNDRLSDRDVAIVTDQSYLGRLNQGVDMALHGTRGQKNKSDFAKIIKSFQVATRFVKNKNQLLLAGNLNGLDDVVSSLTPSGKERTVTNFESFSDPAFLTMSENGILDRLSSIGMSFAIQGNLYRFDNGKLQKLDDSATPKQQTSQNSSSTNNTDKKSLKKTKVGNKIFDLLPL